MITKIPQFTFSSYKEIALRSTLLISEDQFNDILQALFSAIPGMEDLYNNLISSYTFTNNVPKLNLIVTLAKNITDERRNYISNGLR